MGEHTNDKRFWLGIVLVLIGGAWLLDNLNIVPYYLEDYIFSWGSLFILIGLYLIAGRRKYEPGVVFIALGSLFFLREIYWFNWHDMWQVFWPAIVIVIGLSLILRRSRGRESDYEKKSDVDTVDDFAIFGGRERTIDSQNFQGGKITAIFGGSEIHLGGAQLVPGRSVLDVFVLFGGTDIKVPVDWTVHVEVFSLLGGFSDNRSKSSLQVVPDPNKVLVVKGFVMFGGGEIRTA